MYVLTQPDAYLWPFLIKKEYVGRWPSCFSLFNSWGDLALFCRELTPVEAESELENGRKIQYLTDTCIRGSVIPCLLIRELKSIEEADRAAAAFGTGLTGGDILNTSQRRLRCEAER